MQVGSTLSMGMNGEDSPELSHRTARRAFPISTPTATPPMRNQKFNDAKRVGTNSESSAIDSGSHKRPILAIRTVSPLVRHANDNTSPTYPMAMRHNFDPVPKYTQLGSDTPPANGHRRKGKEKSDVLFQHGSKKKKNEPTFSSKIRDILEWRTMKAGLSVCHEREENDDHGSAIINTPTKKAAGSMRDLWKGRQITSPDKGPKAGQVYEIVNRHVVEDNIDRTVTISTWRERVDEGDGSDADNMSIYYISPDGYAHEGGEVNVKFRKRLLESSHGSKRENQGTSYRQVGAVNGPLSTSTKSRANYNGYQHIQYKDTGSTTTDPLRQKNTIPSASNKDSKHKRSRAKDGGVRSNSPPFIQRQRQYQESTPIEKELPRAPFHPTRNGSTISSIRPVSNTDFEKFLEGCKPSLVHVSEILRSLGIYQLEHLKAIARLSPETRDREVKEDALRLGMTVMEWAILVDELLQF